MTRSCDMTDWFSGAKVGNKAQGPGPRWAQGVSAGLVLVAYSPVRGRRPFSGNGECLRVLPGLGPDRRLQLMPGIDLEGLIIGHGDKKSFWKPVAARHGGHLGAIALGRGQGQDG